jgi:hypothetical protein
MLTPKTSALISPLVLKLAELAALNPELAKMVVTVLVKAVDRSLRTGPTRPAVWFRSLEGAARQFANRKFADEWTKAVALRFPARRPAETIKQRTDKAR